MNFLYPSVLWFLGLLVIPIFIHLFNLRRYQKVFFSNVSFLNSVKSSSRSKLTIKQWLALISRLLALAFLVLTFAIPFLPSDIDFSSDSNKIVYLDNSYSNSNISNDGLTSFDNSSQSVINYVSQFSIEDKFNFLTNDFTSKLKQTNDQITDKISELSFTDKHIGFDVFTSFRNNRSSFYLFSDFQKSQFDFELILADTSSQYFLFPTMFELSRNVFVDSVYLDNPVLNDLVENKLNIKLKNVGNESVTDLPVYFTVNGVQLSSNTVDLEPNGFSSIQLDVSSVKDSINNFKVSFEDFPVTFDNDFYFSIHRTRKIKVLNVIGKETTSYIKNVFASDFFNYSQETLSNLNYSNLNEVDLLVLNELPLIDANLQSAVKTFVNNGGNLLLIPSGMEPEASFFQSITGGSFVKSSSEKSSYQRLEEPSKANPFFEGVFESNSFKVDDISSSYLYQWSHGERILSLKNGVPFLSSFKSFNSTVYILNSSLDIGKSGIAESPLFLPVLYRIAFLSLKEQEHNLYYRKDVDLISWRGEAISKDNVYRLKKGNEIIIPPQRKVNNQVIFDLTGLSISSGFWDVCIDDVNCVGVLSVNQSRFESEVIQYSRDELDFIANNSPNIHLISGANNSLNSESGITSFGNKYLWKYTLLLVLVFFFAEVLILRFL